MIIVDTNSAEDFIYQACIDDNIPVERQRLDVGDVIISLETMKYVLERKTWTDLTASICDGRWSEQKSRMNTQEDITTQYGFIIEGSIIGWSSEENTRMNPSCLWGALVKTQVRDNMNVFHTNDKEATSKLVLYLYKQLTTGGFEAKSISTVSGTSVKRKRDNLSSPESIYIAMLSIIPGMSKTKAETIVKEYPSIKLLMEADKKSIALLKCGNRKLGPALADVISSLLS